MSIQMHARRGCHCARNASSAQCGRPARGAAAWAARGCLERQIVVPLVTAHQEYRQRQGSCAPATWSPRPPLHISVLRALGGGGGLCVASASAVAAAWAASWHIFCLSFMAVICSHPCSHAAMWSAGQKNSTRNAPQQTTQRKQVESTASWQCRGVQQRGATQNDGHLHWPQNSLHQSNTKPSSSYLALQ